MRRHRSASSLVGRVLLCLLLADVLAFPLQNPLQPTHLRRPNPPAAKTLPLDNQLLVMTAPQQDVEAFWQAIQPGVPTGISSNASLPPIVRQLNDGDLAYPGQPLPFGHCSVLMRRTRRQGVVAEMPALREGGDNNDSPRVTGLEGLNVSGESKKTKLYAYHIAAARQAYTNPHSGLTEDLLRSVARDKSARSSSAPLTVMHLCGNKWCMEGKHMVVGRKRYNDQQTACHRGLQSATCSEDADQIRAVYCRHTIKCWTVVYQGDYNEAGAHDWE
jgi:hypothetical protein